MTGQLPDPEEELPPWYDGYGESGAAPSAGWSGPPLASWSRRVAATLVDGLVFWLIVGVSFGVGAALGAVSDVPGTVVIGLGYLGALAFYVWQLVVQGQTGHTIGKKSLGIRLLRELDGQPIGAGRSVLRVLVHVIDQLPCYVGWLWPIWDPKRQTFTDMVMGTVVIRG